MAVCDMKERKEEDHVQHGGVFLKRYHEDSVVDEEERKERR